MDKDMEREIHRFKETFHREFWGAHLSKINLSDEIIEKINAWVMNPKYILFFASTPGIGKTYLSAAMCKNWIEKKYPWHYFDEKRLFSLLRLKIQENQDYAYELKRLCDCPFFILDDLLSSQLTDWQKEILIDLIDMRWGAGEDKATLITSNFPLNSIQQTFGGVAGDRIKSRLNDHRNIVIEILDPEGDKRQYPNDQNRSKESDHKENDSE